MGMCKTGTPWFEGGSSKDVQALIWESEVPGGRTQRAATTFFSSKAYFKPDNT